MGRFEGFRLPLISGAEIKRQSDGSLAGQFSGVTALIFFGFVR
jgi:hypothetical protein